MNLVTTINGAAVTTSLAIAEGTQNEHRAVLQLARTYLGDLEEFGGVAFEMRPFETPGGVQKREIAILNEQQSTLLLTYMRNSDIVRQFKKALVKAFWELAQKAQQPDPIQVLNDPVAMRGLLLSYSERVLSQEATIAEMTPKVAALDRIATPSEGSFCIREAAKILQVKEKQLYQVLIENHWIYRHPMGRTWLAYSPILKKGYMEHKLSNGDKQDGGQWQSTQARITARGVARLAIILGVSGANDGDLYDEVSA